MKCKACYKRYKYIRGSGTTSEYCSSCVTLKRRINLKIKCIKYKGGECQSCGYDICPQALVFHHINPRNKDFSISGAHSRKWSEIKKELDKCVLLCSNCHSEVHWNENKDKYNVLRVSN